jgi:hypothetical protein
MSLRVKEGEKREGVSTKGGVGSAPRQEKWRSRGTRDVREE